MLEMYFLNWPTKFPTGFLYEPVDGVASLPYNFLKQLQGS